MNPTTQGKRTIVAVATAAGRGAIGIVRLSGPEASTILGRVVPSWPHDQPSHQLRLSTLIDPNGDPIDHALVVFMSGPNTYTGDDSVEFHCHGSTVVLNKVLQSCLAAGGSTARPGEFTQTAFLNGRLDLTQAEAVADLIASTNEAAHRLALSHLDGELGQTLTSYREKLVEALVLVEAAIDFSHEEHVYSLETAAIQQRLIPLRAGLEELRKTFDQGRRQREGLRVVIMGGVNAGKSCLFNALSGQDRAIVTPIAGTTRDYLEEEVIIGPYSFCLIDTAGIRPTDDVVELLGIERAHAIGDRADIILWVIDRNTGLEDDLADALSRLKDAPMTTLVVENKADLADSLSERDRRLVDSFEHRLTTSLAEPLQGLDNLTERLIDLASKLMTSEGVL